MPECRPCIAPYDENEWLDHDYRDTRKSGDDETWMGRVTAALVRDWSMRRPLQLQVVVQPARSVEERFEGLAKQWSAETRHISSVSDLISHPRYREIIDLGWDVVPNLLADLRDNNRFWFPALFEITQVRPFDPRDANNSKRMKEAWIRWGQRKGFI